MTGQLRREVLDEVASRLRAAGPGARTALARRLGWTPSAVSQFLSGVEGVSLLRLERVGLALGVRWRLTAEDLPGTAPPGPDP